MSEHGAIGAYLAQRPAASRPTRIVHPADPALPDGDAQIVVLASDDTLAVLGLRRGTALRAILDFADGFAGFSRHARRWRWHAVTQIQLGALLDRLEAEYAAGGGNAVYVYLNGGFVRKHYPFAEAAPPRPDDQPARGDSCRAVNPRLDEILAAFGEASLQATSLHATPGHDSYHCYAPHSGLLGIGRGTTDRQMMCGAVFEYCERWVGMTRPRDSVTAARTALGEAALAPAELLGLSDEACRAAVPGFDPAAPIAWVRATLAGSGACKWVPQSMVQYLLDDGALASRYRNSNGCALGNSFEEAALFGALEVIERDALLATWYSASSPPRIEPASIDCAETAGLLMLLSSGGYEVACFDITLDLGVPTALVLMRGRAPGRLAGFVTCASHPHAAVALRAALAEAQSLVGSAERNLARHRQEARHDPARLARLRRDNQALHYGLDEQRHHFDALCAGDARLDYGAFLRRHPRAERAPGPAYRQLCERLAAERYELVAVDNSPVQLEALGLASARVFIPGTIPLAFGEHPPAIPAGRLARAARRAAWVRADADLAAAPLHPLG